MNHFIHLFTIKGGKISSAFSRHDLKTTLSVIFLVTLLCLINPLSAAGGDRIVVKNAEDTTTFKVTDNGVVLSKYLTGVQSDKSLAQIGSYVSVFDQYGETLLVGGAFNRLNFLTREGGSVTFSPNISSGDVANLFDATDRRVSWANPSGNITITIHLPQPWKYMRELIIQFTGLNYPTSFKIEYYDEDDSSWHTFDDVTNFMSNLYAKKTDGSLYNTSIIKITMREYNDADYVHISEIVWTYYQIPMHNAYVYRGGGQNIYGGINLATESGNVGIGMTDPFFPLELRSGAYVSRGGVWTDASSRAYKEHIHDLPADAALHALQELTPVQYNYKMDKKEEHVGFISEDVPDLLATHDRRGMSPMDVVAVLTKVVQEQQKAITELSHKIAVLEGKTVPNGNAF